MNKDTGIMASQEPVITDGTVTPSAIMSDTAVKVKEEPYDVSNEEQQPPLKKIKVEYESEKEEDDQFADAIDTTTAEVNSAVQEDTNRNNDSTNMDSSNVNLVAEVMPSQPQPPLPLVLDPTPMVTPSDPPMAVSADTTKQDHRVGVEENDDLFGTVEDNKTNENIIQTDDVLVASAAPMVIPQIGDVSTLPSDDHPVELLSEQPVVPTTSATSISEPVSTVGGDSISTPVKAPSTTEFAIPRKSSHSKATTTMARAAVSVHNKQNYTSGTRYGLPVGVNVPGSIVQSKLLEVEMNTPGSKLMDVLKSLPVNLINDALTEYDDAVEIKGANSIRNHGAYLYGVVKRYVSVLERSMNGDTVSGQNPMGEDGLTSAVQIRLDQLVTSGFCTQQEMTDKVKSKIRMLSEKDAMCALDDLSSVDRSQIRNFGSYLMGILNRYMRGEPSSKKSSSSSSSMFPGSGGHNTNTPPNRHSRDHREPPNNRFAPALHNNNNNTSFTSSSFSSSYPPNSRKNNNDGRLDQRGNHHGGSSQRPPFRMDQSNNNNNNNLQSFDGHRQQQPQQQGTHLVPSWQQNQPTPPNQYMGGQGNMPNHMVPSMNNPTNPNISGIPPTNFNYHGQQQQMQQYPPPQQMQPSSYMPQPPVPQQSFGQPSPYSITNNMQPQTGLPPNTSGMYQPQPNGMMMGQQPHQQPFLANPSSQQQQPPTLMNQSSSQFVPNHMSQVPQSSIDIMGLADKAASAIQALGANNKLMGQPVYNPPQQQQGYHQQQQQQPSYNAVLGQPQSSSMMMPQSSRPGQPMFGQNQMYPPQQPQHQQPPVFGGSNMANQPPPQQQQGARRRTTASFHELPMSVQYALQNLIASGAIDGQPDDGILGMIMDLPEQMALVGLQKFAAVDKSTMRNRFAYLAGVLRRELAAINRR